jgi:hypothetical protein
VIATLSLGSLNTNGLVDFPGIIDEATQSARLAMSSMEMTKWGGCVRRNKTLQEEAPLDLSIAKAQVLEWRIFEVKSPSV